MRLWSIHPEYLDAKGLVALWREGLLAKAVLENKTKGYRNHPQLNRFKATTRPLAYVKFYLHIVCDVAESRGYSFSRQKLGRREKISKQMPVNTGQANYEWKHLLKKLRARSPELFLRYRIVRRPRLHPLFKKKPGRIEPWEIVTP